MKYNKNIFFILLILPLFVDGQSVQTSSIESEKGIHFEHVKNWEAVLAKAKQEHKFIFLDCYATWCAPCKYMARAIFSNAEVGDYFNQHFINVVVQMDRTLTDASETKAWYAQADSLAKLYKIDAYPTYLFFSADGSPVHRIVGSTATISGFLNKVKNVIDPSKQYYTLISHWKENKSDSTYLLNTLKACLNASDNQKAALVGGAYLESQHSPVTKENIELFTQIISSSKDPAFQLLIKNASKVNAIMGEGYLEEALSNIIFKEEIAPLFINQTNQLSWNKIVDRLKMLYPNLGPALIKIEQDSYQDGLSRQLAYMLFNSKDVIVNWNLVLKNMEVRFLKSDFYSIYLMQKASYYARKKQWPDCLSATYLLLHQYGGQLDARDLNNIAWDFVFLHCDDRKIILETQKYLKASITQRPTRAGDIDTYANLLYKIGEKEQGVLWENKAIEIGKENFYSLEDMKEFTDNLEKMKRGEPTWVDKL